MPSAILKKKMPKTFSRKMRSQRRACAQASPASYSKVAELMGDKVLPRPISSNAVKSARTSSPHAHGEVEDVEDRFTHANDVCPTPDITMKDDMQSGTPATMHHSQLAGKAEVPKRASLMGLPVELRIMIFKRVFPPSDPRGATETILYCAPTLRVLGPSHSQLCRVNRQIYEETRGLLYGQTLVFLSREALTKFSSTRTCQQMSQLRSICMKPRVTDWAGAIKTLVLPPGASLTVHWPITRALWEALTANVTLDYRQVSVLFDHKEQRVVFEPVTAIGAQRPTYDSLQRTFAIK